MIVFQNPGLIDLAAVTTMGISVKDGETPIGYFGTGLKFAIATILRGGGSITIHRGLDTHVFTAEPLKVRGVEFQQVCMDGLALGFTTQLGKNWEGWMAFRELASNCRDEGGHYFQAEPGADVATLLAAECTTVAVTWDELAMAYADRQDILLEGTPLWSSDELDIYPGPSPFVFYRGVRVHTPMKRTAMLYSIKAPLDLTEDRTAKNEWQVQYRIQQALAKVTDEAILRQVLTCGDGFVEHALDFHAYCYAPSDEFAAVVNRIALGSETAPNANPQAVQNARTKAIHALQPGEGMTLDQRETIMLDGAVDMLTKGGFAVTDFPIICVESLGPGIAGLAQEGKIFVSRLAFEKGAREVAATVLEEYAHLRSGAADCTRAFQNWLFDQLLIRMELDQLPVVEPLVTDEPAPPPAPTGEVQADDIPF